MTAQRFLAYPSAGKLILDEPGRWSGLLAKLEGKRLLVTVEPAKRKRSLKANSKLWVSYKEGVSGLEEWTGHSTKEIHEFLKLEYCPEHEVVVCGVRRMIRSTAILTPEDFSAYLERCLAFFAQQGIEVS